MRSESFMIVPLYHVWVFLSACGCWSPPFIVVPLIAINTLVIIYELILGWEGKSLGGAGRGCSHELFPPGLWMLMALLRSAARDAGTGVGKWTLLLIGHGEDSIGRQVCPQHWWVYKELLFILWRCCSARILEEATMLLIRLGTSTTTYNINFTCSDPASFHVVV